MLWAHRNRTNREAALVLRAEKGWEWHEDRQQETSLRSTRWWLKAGQKQEQNFQPLFKQQQGPIAEFQVGQYGQTTLALSLQKGPVAAMRCWEHLSVLAGQCMKSNSRMSSTCRLYMAQCAEPPMPPLPDLQGEPQDSSREKVRLSFISEADLSRSKIYFFFFFNI